MHKYHKAYGGNARGKGPSTGPKVDPSMKNDLQVSTSHVVDRTVPKKVVGFLNPQTYE